MKKGHVIAISLLVLGIIFVFTMEYKSKNSRIIQFFLGMKYDKIVGAFLMVFLVLLFATLVGVIAKFKGGDLLLWISFGFLGNILALIIVIFCDKCLIQRGPFLPVRCRLFGYYRARHIYLTTEGFGYQRLE